MNPFTASNLALAKRRLDLAIMRLEVVAAGGPQSWIGSAYADMLAARGCIAAAEQLEELEAVVGRAPTEPPPAPTPALRLVST